MFKQQNQHEQAIEDFNKASEIEPNYPVVYLNSGRVLLPGTVQDLSFPVLGLNRGLFIVNTLD